MSRKLKPESAIIEAVYQKYTANGWTVIRTGYSAVDLICKKDAKYHFVQVYEAGKTDSDLRYMDEQCNVFIQNCVYNDALPIRILVAFGKSSTKMKIRNVNDNSQIRI